MDVAGARKAGFRDDEILNVAAKEFGISPENLAATLKAYTPAEVLETLSKSNLPPPSTEKPFTEEQPTVSAATRFGKVMENLSRPNYAMAQGASAALEGKPILPAMKKGWNLTEPKVFGDVIQEQMEKRAPGFVAEHPTATAAASTIGGLVGDVALDPTTYLPGGVGLAWKGAKRIPGVAAGAAKARSVAKDAILGNALVSDVGRLFSNQVGSREHREAYDILKKYEDLQGFRAGTAVKEMADLDKRIVKLAKETGEDLSSLRGRIIDSVEKRAITENPTINDVVDSLVTRNAEQLAKEKAAGLGTGEVTRGPRTGTTTKMLPRVMPEGKEPPIPKGYVRLYRGEHPDPSKHISDMWDDYGKLSDQGSGGWFSDDRVFAEYFRDSQKRGAHIVYLDLPAEKAAKYRTTPPGYGAIDGINPAGESAWFIPELRRPSGSLEKMYETVESATPETKAVDYFIHALSDDGKKWLEKNGGPGFKGVSRQMTDTHASMIQRKYGDMSVAEVNAAMRNKGVKGDFFLVDPARAQAIRDVRSARAITGAEFYDEMGKTFGAKEGEGLVAVKPDRLKGQMFPPEVAKVIDSHFEKFTNPQEVNTVLRHYDAAQNWWKAWTLGIFPAYHARNMAGNIWNNSLAGVRNPQVYKIAMDMQRGNPGVLKTALGDMSYEDVVKLAGERGVFGKGFYGGDIPGAVDDALVKGKWITLSKDNKLVRSGRKLGSAIEDNARLAHFVYKLGKGMDADAAAKSVKKFLFDYTELTAFEQNVMKRAFPFYSWSRKNLPLQLEMMVRRPGQQLLPVKLKHEIERNTAGDSPIPEANLPAWLAGDYPIRTKGKHADENDPNKSVFSYTPVAGYLPWGDLPRITNNPAEAAGFMVSPLLKEPAQQAANYDMYFKRKIANEEIPQAYVLPSEGQEFTRFMGVKLSPRAAHVARNIRLLATLHRANPFQVFGEGTSELGTGEKLSQYILGARTYDVDEVTSMIQGMYSEKKKMDGLQKDLYVLGRELGKAEAKGNVQAAKDASDRIKLITDAITRIGQEEVPKHIAR